MKRYKNQKQVIHEKYFVSSIIFVMTNISREYYCVKNFTNEVLTKMKNKRSYGVSKLKMIAYYLHTYLELFC